MAAQEIITLLEGTPQLMAPQTGNTYSAPRTVTITPETNTKALVLTGGTVTASNPTVDITQTFNNGAVNFTGFKANFTNTASAGYLMFDWQLAGSSKLSFDGTTLLCASSIKAGTNLQAATSIWGNTNSSTFNLGSSADVELAWIAAGIIKLSNGSTGAGVIRLNPVTVASLPSAATAGNGARAHVTDALAPTFGSSVTGLGAVSTPVYSDGAVWRVG